MVQIKENGEKALHGEAITTSCQLDSNTWQQF